MQDGGGGGTGVGGAEKQDFFLFDFGSSYIYYVLFKKVKPFLKLEAHGGKWLTAERLWQKAVGGVMGRDPSSIL